MKKKINKKKSSGVFCQEKPNKFMRFYYFNKDLLQQFHPEIHQKRIKTPGIKFFYFAKASAKETGKTFLCGEFFYVYGSLMLGSERVGSMTYIFMGLAGRLKEGFKVKRIPSSFN